MMQSLNVGLYHLNEITGHLGGTEQLQSGQRIYNFSSRQNLSPNQILPPVPHSLKLLLNHQLTKFRETINFVMFLLFLSELFKFQWIFQYLKLKYILMSTLQGAGGQRTQVQIRTPFLHFFNETTHTQSLYMPSNQKINLFSTFPWIVRLRKHKCSLNLNS